SAPSAHLSIHPSFERTGFKEHTPPRDSHTLTCIQPTNALHTRGNGVQRCHRTSGNSSPSTPSLSVPYSTVLVSPHSLPLLREPASIFRRDDRRRLTGSAME